MSGYDQDDLDEGLFDDDPIVRALRAPATAAELERQGEFVAAFRSQRSVGSIGRVASRFGIGATAVVTSIALSGGVAAAAYTNSLPTPVQQFAHEVLGPVGVPAARAERPEAERPAPRPSAEPTVEQPGAVPLPTPGVTPGPTPTPGATPTTAPVPTPTGLPTPTPSGTPSASPSPTTPSPSSDPSAPPTTPAPDLTPGTLSLTVSSTRVAAGSTVTVRGQLTSVDGTPLSNRLVRLSGRNGSEPWQGMTFRKTDDEGRVVLQSSRLDESTTLRLTAATDLTSALVRVVVVPTLSATASTQGDVTTIQVYVRGGQKGDVVAAFRRQGEDLIQVGAAELGSDGTAVITLPAHQGVARFFLELPETDRHDSARTSLNVGGQKNDE